MRVELSFATFLSIASDLLLYTSLVLLVVIVSFDIQYANILVLTILSGVVIIALIVSTSIITESMD